MRFSKCMTLEGYAHSSQTRGRIDARRDVRDVCPHPLGRQARGAHGHGAGSPRYVPANQRRHRARATGRHHCRRAGTYTESLFLVGRKSCANEEGILAPANLTIRTTNPRRPGDTMLKVGERRCPHLHKRCLSNCRIEGFVITGGNNALGGGIRCEDSNPTIAYCHIGRNQAGVGGGVVLQKLESTAHRKFHRHESERPRRRRNLH